MLAGAIPITQRAPAHVSLKQAGWPMVVVDDWEEIADEAQRDRWWEELSPMLFEVRSRGVLTADGWMRYLTHLTRPEPRVEDGFLR